MLKRIGWLGAILLLATVPGGFAETSEDGFKPAGVLEPTYSDVAYGPHPRNVLDFWQAESERPAPLVVYIHGGGFTGGDKSGFVGRDGRQVRRCLEKGVNAATINYPFVRQKNLLDILRDTARAIQYLRHNADSLNIDKKRVAVYGGSAGAGASLWMAFNDDLADPEHPDPVLRESTRVVAAGGNVPQATYDFPQWPTFLELPPWLWEMSSGMVCPLYYHFEKEEVDSEKGRQMRRDLDMLAMIDASDPPVWLRCERDNTPSETWDHMLHHPGHVVKLAEVCREKGVPVTVILKDTPSEERIDVLDFLFEALLRDND